ncbi:ABC transporter permease [Azohydromonas caseinilytica]|uniref:ABC transporter permease n=1 Tax=Azohydromonas caseinilytica TaxID=2728836 RepID=A0A848FAD1_9BURK|nr:ABC transporter permease [Azohydromonas caseinilytica]NML17127.1 ABC transporter permease [Azohydromonas caseinilytica]
MARARGRGAWPVALAPVLVLLVLFVAPTLIMVAAAFRQPGDYGGLQPIEWRGGAWREAFTLEQLRRLFDSGVYLAVLGRSFAYATLTTLLCLLLGYPLAWAIARAPGARREGLLLLVILPFWSNFLVRVYAWMILLGAQGYLARVVNAVAASFGADPVPLLFTPFAVVVVLVYVHLPFMVLPLYANLEKHDPALLDAAQDLGAGAWQRFRHVSWPLSLPGVWAGTALVFVPALGVFAVPDLVGGTSSLMIGNVIKQQFLDSRDWPFGSMLSLLLTLAVLGVTALVVLAARRGGRHA